MGGNWFFVNFFVDFERIIGFCFMPGGEAGFGRWISGSEEDGVGRARGRGRIRGTWSFVSGRPCNARVRYERLICVCSVKGMLPEGIERHR